MVSAEVVCLLALASCDTAPPAAHTHMRTQGTVVGPASPRTSLLELQGTLPVLSQVPVTEMAAWRQCVQLLHRSLPARSTLCLHGLSGRWPHCRVSPGGSAHLGGRGGEACRKAVGNPGLQAEYEEGLGDTRAGWGWGSMRRGKSAVQCLAPSPSA